MKLIEHPIILMQKDLLQDIIVKLSKINDKKVLNAAREKKDSNLQKTLH